MINTIDDFIEYTKKMNGKKVNKLNCNDCERKKVCDKAYKYKMICELLERTEPKKTRYPRLACFIQKVPFTLYLIPPKNYIKFFGGYKNDVTFCPFDIELIVKNIDKIKKTYDILSDEQSRSTYLNILSYRLTCEKKYLKKALTSDDQYFIDDYCNLGPDEIYVDCGAFTGDTFARYCVHNAEPKSAYFFEPDSLNLKELELTVKQTSKRTNINIIQKGVWDKTKSIWFVNGHGSSCYVSEEEIDGATEISVASIDDCIKGPITFLKMDIEGSETKALIGANNLIKNNYPKLAISIYHNVEDLFEIPTKIKELYPQYTTFKIRHYVSSESETVLFAYK